MNGRTAGMPSIQARLSTLWIVVMLLILSADIFGFMIPGALEGIISGTGPIQVTQELMLVFAAVLTIPIVMVYLSRVLRYEASRWANIIAAVITILFVIGGGSPYLHYYFFASVEIACMLLIIWYAWKWRSPDGSPIPAVGVRRRRMTAPAQQADGVSLN